MKNNKISTLQLAQICNVSQGTVDRALHNRSGIKPETRQRIIDAARKYGYRPESVSTNRTVGIIVFDLYNDYFSELITKTESTLRNIGYYSIIMFTDKDKQNELECIEKMYNAGVDAIILCPVNSGNDFASYLKSWKIPIITLGNKVDGIKYIGINNHLAMYEFTKELISKGHKKLIYYSPALSYKSSNIYAQKERMTGFADAVSECGVKFCIITSRKELDKLAPYDGWVIMASTDYYALELLFSKQYEDSVVTGFDNIATLSKLSIDIATVDSDISKTAQAIAASLIDPNAEDVYIPHTLIGL